MTSTPVCHDEANEDIKIYPACAVTRAMAKANKQRDDVLHSSHEGITTSSDDDIISGDATEVSREPDDTDSYVNLSETFMDHEAKEGMINNEEGPEPKIGEEEITRLSFSKKIQACQRFGIKW